MAGVMFLKKAVYDDDNVVTDDGVQLKHSSHGHEKIFETNEVNAQSHILIYADSFLNEN